MRAALAIVGTMIVAGGGIYLSWPTTRPVVAPLAPRPPEQRIAAPEQDAPQFRMAVGVVPPLAPVAAAPAPQPVPPPSPPIAVAPAPPAPAVVPAVVPQPVSPAVVPAPSNPPRAANAAPGGIQLQFPVACTLGQDCFVQNYIDRDSAGSWRDFTCGYLSYNDHRGTDIAVPDRAAMQRGVAVMVAAAGRVVGVRNNVPDAALGDADAPDITDRDCGNGTRVDHGNGWETQYCHLRRGSVVLQVGQQVQAGDTIGLIGLSGRTEFPHLHFQVEHNRRVVDPFDARPATEACGQAGQPLWAEPVSYAASGLISAGFAAGEVSQRNVDANAASPAELPAGTPALTMWAWVFGARAGDTHHFRILRPDGSVMLENRSPPADRNQARQFRFVGQRLRGDAWPAGTYRGEYRLLRGAQAVASATRTIVLR